MQVPLQGPLRTTFKSVSVPEPILPTTIPPRQPEPEPPLAGPNVMNVVMVGAECAPWSKTGELQNGSLVGYWWAVR
eukprot:1156524-Pelagomonas_calceolata.AAC.4